MVKRGIYTVLLALISFSCFQIVKAGESLKLSGKIINIKVEDRNDSMVLTVNANMSFKNVSKKTILLVKSSYPISSSYYIPNNSFMGICSRISGVLATGTDEKVLYSRCALPSIEATSDWQIIKREFDSKTPPLNRIQVMNDGESFEFVSSSEIRFSKKQDPFTSDAISNEIKKAKSLKIEFTYRIWSLELEARSANRDERPFGKKLQKRWTKYGYLWLDDIISEPIPLDLSSAVTKID